MNGAAEWAYGVADWFEQGLYMPLYSPYSDGRGATINGFKLRELFVRPHAHEHKFFYGMNFEFGVNARYWKPRRISSEIRPIVGIRLGQVDCDLQSDCGHALRGRRGGLDTSCGALAYNFNQKWAVATEEYADMGQLNHFVSAHNQLHEVWAVTNYNGRKLTVETGVGLGLTAASDRLTFKVMVSRDLNSRH